MLNKKVTRKEFLLSGLSVVALLAVSKIPSAITKKLSLAKPKESNTYGNYYYGGKGRA